MSVKRWKKQLSNCAVIHATHCTKCSISKYQMAQTTQQNTCCRLTINYQCTVIRVMCQSRVRFCNARCICGARKPHNARAIKNFSSRSKKKKKKKVKNCNTLSVKVLTPWQNQQNRFHLHHRSKVSINHNNVFDCMWKTEHTVSTHGRKGTVQSQKVFTFSEKSFLEMCELYQGDEENIMPFENW